MATRVTLAELCSLPIGFSLLLIQTFNSLGATLTPPTSISSFLKNMQVAGDECLLLEPETFTKNGMLQLAGARDADFFVGGNYAPPGNTDPVQVRAGDFGDVLPAKSWGDPRLQVVGRSGSDAAFLSFVISFGGAEYNLNEAESALGRDLVYVKLPPPPPQFEGVPPDPSYYLLEHSNTRCHYRLQIHLYRGRLDGIYVTEDRRP